jgi:hypothetical protein
METNPAGCGRWGALARVSVFSLASGSYAATSNRLPRHIERALFERSKRIRPSRSLLIRRRAAASDVVVARLFRHRAALRAAGSMCGTMEHMGALVRTPLEVAAYGRLLATALASCSGQRLLGAYLHGSAAMGGWLAARSDVDLLFVLEDAAPGTALGPWNGHSWSTPRRAWNRARVHCPFGEAGGPPRTALAPSAPRSVIRRKAVDDCPPGRTWTETPTC